MCVGKERESTDALKAALLQPQGQEEQPLLSWRQISEASSEGRKLLVINKGVYDVSNFVQQHPGGKVLLTYVGEDASDAFAAFHRDHAHVSKFLRALKIAELDESLDQNSPAAVEVRETRDLDLEKDFRNLRSQLEEAGMFNAKLWWYALVMVHVIGFELAGWMVLWQFGTGWVPYSVAVVLLVTAQAQAGWLQHDFGHLSVFRSRRLNLLFHRFVIIHMKAASSAWWNYRHYLHHAKPNISDADPDVNMPHVFMLGEEMPKRWAKRQKEGKAPKVMPYNRQHQYWWAIGPPLLLPLYFHYENISYIFGNAIFGRSGLPRDSYATKRYLGHGRKFFWEEAALMISFFVRWHYMYGPVVGGAWAWFTLYMVVRTVESHWFVWVTQMSHIPMAIGKYASTKERDWLSLQINATCNVDGGWFNDWFTGHLNYQIEHHLFPTMPRHNYAKVAPLVKSLLEKHGKRDRYISKSLLGAFGDIVSSLERYGHVWEHAYFEG